MAAQFKRVQPKPLRKVTEPVRERETFKYYSSLPITDILNESGEPPSTSNLTSADDVVLTALAQAGAFQTATDRSLISLFDADRQYIVAEATRSSRLHPSVKSEDCSDPLWLCGTAIPRSHGVCELSLLGEDSIHAAEAATEASTELPLTLADDLVVDPRFCAKPYCQPGTLCRFYAAVPIRTRRGINIGVYCVINETPGKIWSDEYTERLRDISRTIMDYLESKRLGELHRRNERMNRGLGSFIEGKSTISGWQSGPFAAAFVDKPTMEGSLNPRQQYLQLKQDEMENDIASVDTIISPSQSMDTSTNGALLPRNQRSWDTDGSGTNPSLPEERGAIPDEESPAGVLSKAANIIRESAEVEGCLFVDATMEAYRSPSQTNTGNGLKSQLSATSSSDESPDHGYGSGERPLSYSKLLAYSTTDASSIDGATSSHFSTAIPEKCLAKLLRRYPKGRVFIFGADGELQTSDSSEDDRSLSPVEFSEEHSLPQNRGARMGCASSRDKLMKKKRWGRQHEGSILLDAFPGARSVAFVPMWDPRRDRWYAGGFIYTNIPTRIFTREGELSYLRALGMLAMAEILRFNDLIADKAKSDILGSLSHELRSPLHGVILSAELLADTKLDVFQGNVANTIEICSRTLLDTIDHLLDYSKVNNVRRRDHMLKARGGSRAVAAIGGSTHSGDKDLSCNCRLDGLVEEVVESVFAGYAFQHLPVKQPSQARLANSDLKAMDELDPMQTKGGALNLQFGAVSIILSIDARYSWAYFVPVGAFRRIVMNIFGNALKYTHRGTIKVSLTQETISIQRQKRERVIKFTVEDTGKGIGEDFLRHGLFRPFSQEDTLTPGTGLGLSLVKQIVSQLRGEVSIHSQVGIGTTVSVAVPVEQVRQSPETALLFSDEDKLFEEQIQDLKGLRIRLSLSKHHHDGGVPDWHKSVAYICREWLRMEVVSDTVGKTTPDLVLWSHDALPTLSRNIETLAKRPNVVICSNALVAYHQSKSFQATGHAAILEFISQPTGPRKLARALLLAYTRWMNVSDFPTSTYSTPTAAKRPKGPQRIPSSFIVPDIGRPPLGREMSFSYNGNFTSTDGDETSRSSSPNDGTSAIFSPLDESLVSYSEPDETFGKFLLVDDNHINLKVLSAYMKKLGLEFDTAMNGKEAVDLFCPHPCAYSCVLMDVSMPVMNGFEATRCIRAHEFQEGLKPVPIIALSGLASEDAHQEAIGSGMDLFLTKPVKLKALGGMLESMGILKP
ncbi:Peroxide stress-activated histidine kinase mak1 [Cladobotryum mycophilum]|uniref:Peroxide stress-activated histidine kinase mak1 n=1 Tax=Cladobotryum mycophilum TaxID=491253 RepID=A0ABR0SW25_9HYPO